MLGSISEDAKLAGASVISLVLFVIIFVLLYAVNTYISNARKYLENVSERFGLLSLKRDLKALNRFVIGSMVLTVLGTAASVASVANIKLIK
jgi:ABC-type Fe3+ transport system permease subunit